MQEVLKENNFECRKCGEIKPVSDFIKDRSRKRGHHPYCRLCQNKIKNNKRTLERSLLWQKNNKDKRKVIKSKWSKNNIEKVRALSANNRASTFYNSNDKINYEDILSLDKKVCGICRENLDWAEPNLIHLDHIVPLSKGGKNIASNIQWSHMSCNIKKSNKI